MAGCGPCPDSCNCQVADEFGVLYPGSGDAGSPIIVPRAIPETVFAAGSAGGTVIITPAGPYGHTPNFDVNVCAILEEVSVRNFGRLLVFSNDADCKPERLRNPAENEYLGYDPVSGEATWLTLPTDFSLTIDPDSTAPVSFGPNGLRVDCCPLPDPEVLLFTVNGNFDFGDYPDLAGIWVELQGGGGGSGGTDNNVVGTQNHSAGGGGGGYSKRFFAVTELAASEPIVIGAAGAAGGNHANGGAGGTTTFGAGATLFSATGGGGGDRGEDGTTNHFDGGTGGVGVGGDINVSGDDGFPGCNTDNSPHGWGGGGGGPYGGGIQGRGGTNAPVVGNAPGGGAKGRYSTGGVTDDGAAGAAGRAWITTVYYNT